MSSELTQSFSPLETAVVMAMGVVCGCVATLQPILLGSLLDQGQLSLIQMGHAATAEALAMAVSTTLAAMFLTPAKLRHTARAALTLAFIANTGTTLCSGTEIILLRGLNGLCSGILLWILVGLLARTRIPGKSFAIYITSSASTSFLFSLLLNNWLVEATGATGGYLVLATVDLLLMIGASIMPGAFKTAESHSKHSLPPFQGLLGIFAVGFMIAAVMGFWVYVIPLGIDLGYPAAALKTAVSLAIGAQIVAGLCAVIWSSIIRPFLACLAGTLLIISCVVVFMNASITPMLYVCLILFAFMWMFVPPFQMPFLIELDPSLRSAVFIGTAQLSGSALGPILSAQLIEGHGTIMAAYTSITLALSSMGLLIIARLLGSKQKEFTSSPAA